MALMLVGIHGVGDPRPGTIKAALLSVLRSINISAPVEEIHWNSQIAPTTDENALRREAFLELESRLAHASLPLSNRTTFNEGAFRSLLAQAHAKSFFLAETATAALFAEVVWMTLFLCLISAFRLGYVDSELFPIAIVKPWIRMTATILGGSLAGFAITGIVRSFIYASSSMLFETIRRIIVLIVRPLILLAYSVFLVTWEKVWNVCVKLLICLFVFAMFLSIEVAAMIAVTASFKVFPGGSWRELLGLYQSSLGVVPLLVKNVSIAILIWLAAYAARQTISMLTHTVMGPALKIFLDIFRYITDLKYRNYLLKFVVQRVQAIKREQPAIEVIIVAHSLGAVIALDSLINTDIWKSFSMVTLITVGSPLKRFFYRFFPGVYFPGSADECALAIASRHKFRWVNSFRRFDYIGRRIGLTRDSWKSEVPINRWFPWHTGYFGDESVANTIKLELNELGYCGPLDSVESFERSTFELTPAYRARIELVTSRSLKVLSVLLPIGLLCSAFVEGGVTTYNHREQLVHQTVASGFWTVAAVAYSQRMEEAMGEVGYETRFEFTYNDSRRERHVRSFSHVFAGPFTSNDLLVKDNWYFGVDDLAGKFPFCVDKPECVPTNVPVWVSRDNPEYFVVPGCLPRFGFLSVLSTLISRGFLALLASALAGIVIALTLPVFRALVGRAIEDQNSKYGGSGKQAPE